MSKPPQSARWIDIEVHPCPERALSDGPQSLDLPDSRNYEGPGEEVSESVKAA